MTHSLFDWTNEAIKEFRILWAQGISCEECAEKLMAKFGGFLSRSSITGKKKRLKLTARRQNGGSVAEPYEPRKRSKPRRKPSKLVVHIIASGGNVSARAILSPEAIEPTITSLSPDEIPIAQRKHSVLELKPRDCRWPYGDPGRDNFFFCGAVTLVNSSYCPFHAGVSSAGLSERRRVA